VTYHSADEEPLADKPNMLHAFDLALLAGIGFAIVYGVASEPIRLSFGLIAVALIGGVVIGGAVSRGAWAGKKHVTLRRLQVLATLIALGSWVVGLFVAYVMSQLLFPQATTPLLERISFSGFNDYFVGLFDSVRFAHAASVAAAVFMAWRGAR
jgi:hypothetical protein